MRKRKHKNPGYTRLQVIARFAELLRDPDIATLSIAQDLLAEYNMTLVEVSEALALDAIGNERLTNLTTDDLFANGSFTLSNEDSRHPTRGIGPMRADGWGRMPTQERTNAYVGVDWIVRDWGEGRWFVDVAAIFLGDDIRPFKYAHPAYRNGFDKSFFYTPEEALAHAIYRAWFAVYTLNMYSGASLKTMTEALTTRGRDPTTLAFMDKVPPEILDPTTTAMTQNPPRSDKDVLKEIETLLLDSDPSTIRVAEDLLLEHEWTLANASEGLFGPPPKEYPHAGAFMVSRPIGTGQVEWYTSKTSTGARYFWFCNVAWKGESFSVGPGHRVTHMSECIAEASATAWRIVIAMKNNREIDFDSMRLLIGHAVPAADAGPRIGVRRDAWMRIQLPRLTPELVSRDTIVRAMWERWQAPIDAALPTAGSADEWEPDLEPNPPWVTRVLADSFEALSQEVPPQWMPKLAGVRQGPRGSITAFLREYGCGAYGCVLPTLDTATVLKVTTDDTEAEFASQLAADLVAPICVGYYMAISLEATHEGRQIFLLWRESADDVGEVRRELGEDAGDAILAQHEAAKRAFMLLHQGVIGGELDGAISVWKSTLLEMQGHGELVELASGMMRVFDEQGIFFGDIHEGNVGRVFRGGEHAQWVITDPGHVAVVR